jgi:hypothetical protein
VAQLDRASDFGSDGWGFDSLQACHITKFYVIISKNIWEDGMVKNQRLSYIYAAIAVFFWSTVATAFKISLSYVSSFTLLFYASLFSTIILFFVLVFSKDRKIFSRKQILYSAFLGFINPFAYYLILYFCPI